MSEKFVSVIINCRNSEKFLKSCLESVLNQSYKDFEVLIIDNNSTDKTKEIIQSFSDKRISYYYLKKTLSLGNARNFALDRSKGELIAFIDSDDLWHRDKLSKIVCKFSEKIGLVYSDVEYFNEIKSFRLYSYRKIYRGKIFNDLLYDYNLCMSSCVVSSDVIKKNDIKFDKRLQVCEDLDFFLKISYVSKVEFVPELLTRYRIHKNNLTSRHPELFFEEYELTISNLIDFYNIEKDYFKKAFDHNCIKKSRFLWKNKKIKEAFLTIDNIKILKFHKIFYSILFLIPFEVVKYLYDKLFGTKVEFYEN